MKINTNYKINDNYAKFKAYGKKKDGHEFFLEGKLTSNHPKKRVKQVFREFEKLLKHDKDVSKIKKKIKKEVPHCTKLKVVEKVEKTKNKSLWDKFVSFFK